MDLLAFAEHFDIVFDANYFLVQLDYRLWIFIVNLAEGLTWN